MSCRSMMRFALKRMRTATPEKRAAAISNAAWNRWRITCYRRFRVGRQCVVVKPYRTSQDLGQA
jgi:hypothetical protein